MLCVMQLQGWAAGSASLMVETLMEDTPLF